MDENPGLFAGIQYMGAAGGSAECMDAVVRLVQLGDRFDRVRILTAEGSHSLLLYSSDGSLTAVKSGFASGYSGTGPTAFSFVLQLLDVLGTEIDEVLVPMPTLDRLDCSCLRRADLDAIEQLRPVRPGRWHDYINEQHWNGNRPVWEHFPSVIPYRIIDGRLIDIALSFWDAPADRLLSAYRRLEDCIRHRTGLTERGGRLFADAFMGSHPKLGWDGVDKGEAAARAELFRNVYSAFRNRRAHGEPSTTQDEQLSELLLINHLFRLEAEAADIGVSPKPAPAPTLGGLPLAGVEGRDPGEVAIHARAGRRDPA